MITKRIKIGYASDWTESCSSKYQILDETISGKYVCIKAPTVERGYWGQYHLVYSPTSGLCLIDKDEFTKIQKETLYFDY